MKMKEFSLHKIIKGGLGMLILILSANIGYAQQEPLFIQYNFNTQVINPAYAGTWDNPGFLVLGRQQWAGMDGAPRTFTLSVQTPLKFKNVAVGLNVISDKAGFEKRDQVNLDYSYRVQLNADNHLRLGVKGGITNYVVNFADYVGYPDGPPDPMFTRDIYKKLLPNFGVGAFLSSENYYVGLSIPKLLQNEHYNYLSTSAELRHVYLMGGYVYQISDFVQFKPTALTRFVWGAPAIFDLSANFLLNNKVWLGANYRLGDSFGFVAQWIFDNKLRIGYGVEYTTARLRSFNFGTHEVMVSYELSSRRKWSSPRMF